jgi:hypothetical protein
VDWRTVRRAAEIAFPETRVTSQLFRRALLQNEQLLRLAREVFERFVQGTSELVKFDYCFRVNPRAVGSQQRRLLATFKDLYRHVGSWWCFEHYLLLADRPLEFHVRKSARDDEFVAHRESGPAVRYSDGVELWYLNGVPIPREVAEQSAEQLDPELILKEPNAEVRREILRKVGPERFFHKIGGTLLDAARRACDPEGQTWTQYELYAPTVQFPARILKMLNPSVPELWHAEFVPTSCQTVQHALNFRNHLGESQIDDQNGAPWQQQGDVIIRPRGATKFKSFPVLLT